MDEGRSKYFGQKIAFILLMLVALGIYITWGIIGMNEEGLSFGEAFGDIGLYAVTIIPFLFGLFGFLLFRAREKKEATEE